MEAIREVNAVSIAIRIILAILVGGLLGMERGRKNRPAGFRTYIIVCLGATLVMMTNQYVYQLFEQSDPVRMGAQVISGIGFLGAGTIIVTGRNQIKGMTTAAGLWGAACCGLAIGIGFYEGGVTSGVAVFCVMYFLRKTDEKIRKHSRFIDLYMEFDAQYPFSGIIQYIREAGADVSDVQLNKSHFNPQSGLNAVLTLHYAKGVDHESVTQMMNDAPGVYYVEEIS